MKNKGKQIYKTSNTSDIKLAFIKHPKTTSSLLKPLGQSNIITQQQEKCFWHRLSYYGTFKKLLPSKLPSRFIFVKETPILLQHYYSKIITPQQQQQQKLYRLKSLRS